MKSRDVGSDLFSLRILQQILNGTLTNKAVALAGILVNVISKHTVSLKLFYIVI